MRTPHHRPRRFLRGRFHYSLRTFFLLVFVIACGLGLFVNERNCVARRNKNFKKFVIDLGEQPPWRVWLLGDDVVRYALSMDVYEANDDSVRHLAACVQLERLRLDGTAVTDVGLRNLAAHKSLVYLNLARTPVTNDGLQHLVSLDSLAWFALSFTRINDSGLERLAKFKNLRTIELESTDITAAGVKHLVKIIPHQVELITDHDLDSRD